MFNFEETALVTISPNFPPPKCGATRFRWQMHAPLPFVIPSQKCLNTSFERDGRKYMAGFHNHFDRETITSKVPGAIPVVRLVEKQKDGTTPSAPPPERRVFREYLQSVVLVVEDKEHNSVSDAFQSAEKKIKDCFEFLGEYLGQIQRSLPYMTTWSLYPVSIFDVGVVHHRVDHFCPTTNKWDPMGCGVSMSLPRQLRAPLFLVDLEHMGNTPPELDLANELLAEAQLAIFRRIPRLAVLNSFTAAETLANSVYRSMRQSQLIGRGVAQDRAEAMAENERRSHRTDERFLFGSGMKEATGRSLFEENKKVYDDLIRLEENVRHQVSHRGARPSIEEARASLVTCCEAVRWLCDVAGMAKKEMTAALDKSLPGLSATSNSPHVCSPADMEVLRRMFGIVLPADVLESLAGCSQCEATGDGQGTETFESVEGSTADAVEKESKTATNAATTDAAESPGESTG